MSNQDKNSSHITYNDILEIYQKCRKNGDWAKVYLETRGGTQFFTISVNVSAGPTAGTTSGVERESRKKKKPGQVRRDKQRRAEFLERRRQAANSEEAARKDEIREKVAEKMVEIDTGAGETSSGDPVHNSSSASSTVCTWDVGVEAPSPGSLKNMSVDNSDSETEEKENQKWRINVESSDIEKLDDHIKNKKDSKVFKCFSKADRSFLNPIMSVDSAVRQGKLLVLDVSIDSDQFGIGFVENKANWPTFVTSVKRIRRL